MPRVTEKDCWIAAQKSSSAAASAGERCSTAFDAASKFSKSEPTTADDIAIRPERLLPPRPKTARRSTSRKYSFKSAPSSSRLADLQMLPPALTSGGGISGIAARGSGTLQNVAAGKAEGHEQDIANVAPLRDKLRSQKARRSIRRHYGAASPRNGAFRSAPFRRFGHGTMKSFSWPS